MKKQKWCQKCGGLRGESVHESLCQKCIKSLPHCEVCGVICGAREWGYDAEPEAIPYRFKKSGKKIFLCGSCGEKVGENKDLILDKNKKISVEEIEIIGTGAQPIELAKRID